MDGLNKFVQFRFSMNMGITMKSLLALCWLIISIDSLLLRILQEYIKINEPLWKSS